MSRVYLLSICLTLFLSEHHTRTTRMKAVSIEVLLLIPGGTMFKNNALDRLYIYTHHMHE